MKHKMNYNYLKAGTSITETPQNLLQPFYRTFIGLLMMAILITSPSLSHASFLYAWKDTCCVAKNFNTDRYTKLVRISTPDHIDFMKADREIRKNLFKDILNEGKITLQPTKESDLEMNECFQNEYSIKLNMSDKADQDINSDFLISHLNWKLSELESDVQMNQDFYNEGKISLPFNFIVHSDEVMHMNFMAQNIQIASEDQLKKSDHEITNSLMLEVISDNNQ